jgi:hypothetical protein
MDHHSVVLQGRAALQATVDFGAQAFGPAIWEMTASSEAAAEMATSEASPAGPWGDRPALTAYAAANLMMIGVLDNLTCLHQMLGDTMPAIGPTVVARSAIEMASTVWWLMEPRIGVRRRVSRELVLSLISARRAGQVARRMQETGYDTSGQGIAASVTAALQQEPNVLKRITDLGVNSPTGSNFEPVIEGERSAKATDATGAMLRAVIPAAAPSDLVYRTYSAVAHGELYGLMEFMKPSASLSDSPMLLWDLPADILDSTVQLTISAFHQVYNRIRKVMGWGMLAGDLWEAKVRRIYRSGLAVSA